MSGKPWFALLVLCLIIVAVSAALALLHPLAGTILFVLLGGSLGIVLFLLKHRVRGQFFDSNGVRIHYTDEGSGEPVVLVHGLAVNADINWRIPGITRRLRKNYRVISLDVRGHGLSDKPHEASAYGAEMAEDVVRLLDHLKIDKAHVIGYSMGGFITMKLIASHPERLKSAVVGGAGWYKLDTPKITILNELEASLGRGDGFYPLVRALEFSENPSRLKMWAVCTGIAALCDLKAMYGVAAGFTGLLVHEDQLRANQVPTLVMAGTHDPLCDAAKNTEGVLANARVVYLDKADHATALFHDVYRSEMQQHLTTTRMATA